MNTKKKHKRRTLGELRGNYRMNPAVVHGLLRRGETMNVIAPPKTGKSWLVTDLALSVATGKPWFGYSCEKGRVLIIDNELHIGTSAERIPKVVEARGVPFDTVENEIVVENQRGNVGSIADLSDELDELKAEGYSLIIIDAFYRALPKGTDENDNAAIMSVYNLIDSYAAELNCAFVLIHHTSKGLQAFKAVTDVGSGAGSQSRAADTHLILRRHREKDAVVMESVVRSFQKTEAVCLRWNWPIWNRDDTLDPNQLEGLRPEGSGGESNAVDYDPAVIAERLVELVGPEPVLKEVFIDKVKNAYSLHGKTARLSVETAISKGRIRCDRLADAPNGQRNSKFILPAV